MIWGFFHILRHPYLMSSTLFILDTLFSHLKGHVTHSCHKCGWMGSFTTQVFGHESFRPGQMEAPGKPVGQAALSIGPSGKTCKSLSTKFSQTPRRFFFSTRKRITNWEVQSVQSVNVFPEAAKDCKGLYKSIALSVFLFWYFLVDKSQLNSQAEKFQAVLSLLELKRTLLLLATGSGKSLCYQLPAYLCLGCHAAFFQMTWWYLGSRLNQEIWVNLCEDSLSHIGWAAQEFNKGYDWLASDTPKQRTHT